MRRRVRVIPRAEPSTSRQATCSFHFSELKRKTLKFWNRSQIGHRSEYSVERLLAFRDYHERVSLLRVVAVCFLTPIPALAVALAIDCIPLVPPSDGWEANYALWIRLLVAMLFVTVGLLLQVKQVIVPGTISKTGGFVIALGSAIVYVAFSIAVASWRFPIPFGYVVMVGPYVGIFSVLAVLVMGRTVLANASVLQKQIKSQLMIIATQGIVAVAYPAFSATFNQLSGFHQTIFVFMMPIIKFTTKQMIAKTAEHLHEYLGPIVVFSVDVFNVFYVVICMQAATSPITTVIIVCSDSFHVLLALRDIFRLSNAVRVRPHSNVTGSEDTQCKTHYFGDLTAMLQTALQGGGSSRSHTSAKRIRIRAPFPLSLSDESKTILDGLTSAESSQFTPSVQVLAEPELVIPTLETYTRLSPGHAQVPRNPRLLRPRWDLFPAASIRRIKLQMKVLDTRTLSWKKKQPLPPQDKANLRMDTDALRGTLQTLFHSEYVLMAEYVEFMLPMLYALYLSAIFHLPVAAFYPHTQAMTKQKLKSTVASILLFSAIEFAAFVVLLIILKRKFDFSPLYQLAFVLETQFCSVQGHLLMWNLYILHLTLVHYGVDFSAPFE